MAAQTLSIQADSAKLAEIDALAKAQNLSRDVVVNEALDRYLREEGRWTEQVRNGLAAAEMGNFASDAEIEDLFRRIETLGKE